MDTASNAGLTIGDNSLESHSGAYANHLFAAPVASEGDSGTKCANVFQIRICLNAERELPQRMEHLLPYPIDPSEIRTAVGKRREVLIPEV
jgi:hypothetical protein